MAEAMTIIPWGARPAHGVTSEDLAAYFDLPERAVFLAFAAGELPETDLFPGGKPWWENVALPDEAELREILSRNAAMADALWSEPADLQGEPAAAQQRLAAMQSSGGGPPDGGKLAERPAIVGPRYDRNGRRIELKIFTGEGWADPEF